MAHCNASLQHTATQHCNTVLPQRMRETKRTAYYNTSLQHTGTQHYNTVLLQRKRETRADRDTRYIHTKISHCNIALQHTATQHCNTLQHSTATHATQHCNALQHEMREQLEWQRPPYLQRYPLQHSKHFNTLQHSTATQHCNTALQRSTTTQHCNTALHHIERDPIKLRIPPDLRRYLLQHCERWGAGVEYHFQEFNEPYAPS